MSLRVEQDGRVCRITLANPQRRNIFDAALSRDLLAQIESAGDDPATGSVLIDAEGQVFCGGIDAASPPDDALYRLSETAKKPLVVSVAGAAVSAGIGLIANAHVALAAQGSSFALTDIREGRWNRALHDAVVRAIGRRRALELILTGRVFSTQDALAWGLIHGSSPAFEIEDRALAAATALANADPEAIGAALRS